MQSVVSALLSPMILFFMVGAFAGLVRSDLTIPETFAKAMSVYLIAAIGLKGGIQVSEAGLNADLVSALAVGIALSFLLPIPAFMLLRKLGRLDRINAGAVAAHYGSVSVVTFVTGSEILSGMSLAPAGHMVAVMAAMETPAIITGLFLARGGIAKSAPAPGHSMLHETFLNGSVVLLIGAFVVGMAVGKQGAVPVMPFFDSGFRGVLCLFLLDMGLVAARRLRDTGNLTLRLIAIGIALPIMQGIAGVLLGAFAGLDTGSAAILGILAASASYIAVPAVMRMSLPEADPGLYLGMSLAVTFPFNILLGIPFCAELATRLIP